jgi:hypothetical protein
LAKGGISFQRATQAAEKARTRLAKLPGVVGIGVGTKYVGGKPTDAWTISISVVKKRPKGALAASELIPAEIDGVPTDVIETGEFKVLGVDPKDGVDVYDYSKYRPLRGGIKISVSYPSAPGIDPNNLELGTMGCVALTTETPPRHVLITNRHIIATVIPHGPVGQPHPDPGSTTCGAGNELVGNVFDWAKDAVDPTLTDMFPVDAAICALNEGVQWVAGIAPAAVGQGNTPDPIGTIRDLRPAVTPSPPANLAVKKRGMKTGATTGKINNFNFSLPLTAHGRNYTGVQVGAPIGNQTILLNMTMPVLQITADAAPFSTQGDSGCLVCDMSNNVVGLLFASNISGSSVLAAHIQDVLDVLHLTIPTTGAFPGTQTVPANNNPYAKITVSTQQHAMEKLQEDLLQTAHGTPLVRTLFKHVPEIQGVIRSNRRAAAVWQRVGGPHLLKDLAAAVENPELPLLRLDPDVARKAVRRLTRVLQRHGSEQLRGDLQRLAAAAERLIGLSYRGLLERLSAAPAL